VITKKLLKALLITVILGLAGCGGDYYDEYSRVTFERIELQSFDKKGSEISLEAYEEFAVKGTVSLRGRIVAADIYLYLIDKKSLQKKKNHIETIHISDLGRLRDKDFVIYATAQNPGTYQVALCVTNIDEGDNYSDRNDFLTKEQCSLNDKKFDNLTIEVYPYY